MDITDTNIIKQLAINARITNAELAKAIHLSESATLERVRRLEKRGVIEGYTIKTNSTEMGRPLQIIMAISLHNQNKQEIKKFTDLMIKSDEVLSCSQILGRFDFIAHIAVCDTDALQKFINDKLITLGVISKMESLTVLNQIKSYHHPTPL